MEVKIIWTWENSQKLEKLTQEVVKELELDDFLKISLLDLEDKTKQLLNITKNPAFIICEPELDFEDLIFEWFIPEKEDLKNMILSLVWFWWSPSGWCSWSCSSCSWC